ncbi:MAG: ice-binding family protein [Terrimesophilobacter sp.]
MATSLTRVSIPLLVVVGLVVSVGLAVTPGSHSAHAAESSVGLGNAGSFAVLAASTVTNTGPTIVSGDLGVNAGSAVTGFPPGIVNSGAIHATDTLSGLAQNDLVTAYDDAAGRTPTASGLSALDGMTLVPGVYAGGALSLGGTLTLNGSATDVFIFQATSTLDAGAGSHVLLTGGASACNVFWQVASSAVLHTGADFAGTIMALTSVSADTGATITGRLMARTGAVTLDTNVITRPTSCATSAIGAPATPVPGHARFTG